MNSLTQRVQLENIDPEWKKSLFQPKTSLIILVVSLILGIYFSSIYSNYDKSIFLTVISILSGFNVSVFVLLVTFDYDSIRPLEQDLFETSRKKVFSSILVGFLCILLFMFYPQFIGYNRINLLEVILYSTFVYTLISTIIAITSIHVQYSVYTERNNSIREDIQFIESICNKNGLSEQAYTVSDDSENIYTAGDKYRVVLFDDSVIRPNNLQTKIVEGFESQDERKYIKIQDKSS